MLKIGSIIYSDCKSEVLSKEVVQELRNKHKCDELFNIAWENLIKPWLENAYATLNLRTGEIEGNDEFSMRRESPHLIIFKVSLESLSAEDILIDKELDEYEKVEQTLEQFCEKYEIDVKQRAKSYYQLYWDRFSWYIDSIIEENLSDWYVAREEGYQIRV